MLQTMPIDYVVSMGAKARNEYFEGLNQGLENFCFLHEGRYVSKIYNQSRRVFVDSMSQKRNGDTNASRRRFGSCRWRTERRRFVTRVEKHGLHPFKVISSPAENASLKIYSPLE
ncbi:hypothetical protein HGRIS_000948 [Hohenbuehelia grisea]|uniref:Uncharacterized protein n=1 Tax=Hohenbuehelia grisea TaxID=104357 RepID=A0ABR3IQ96_9AGAR